jgi:putative photosynthetic complex assembly protein 2
MPHLWLPALYAIFAWWFSTGVVLYLDRLPKRTFRWTMLGATILLVLSLYGIHANAGDLSIGGAYRSFTWGLLAWAWLEIGFYTDTVTGLKIAPCPKGCSGLRHLGHAIQVSLYHELAIIALAAAVIALTWGQPNKIGLWTFVILKWMHQSARLNVLLGVPNVGEAFLPEHLGFLKSFLTKKPMNALFPVSVSVSTVVAALLAQSALSATAGSFHAVGFTFLTALMGLAILEHWFLVLPLPSARLWRWSLGRRDASAAPPAPAIAPAASGHSCIAAIAPREGEEPGTSATARKLDGARLKAAFDACAGAAAA